MGLLHLCSSGYSLHCAPGGRRESVTGKRNSVSKSVSIAGGNCGEVLLPCYSRDVHQLPAELFTAAGVAGKVAPPSAPAPGKVAPPSAPAPGKVAPPSAPAPGNVAPPSPPAPGEVAPLVRLARGEVAPLVRLARGEVAPAGRLARLNRSVRSTAPAPRSCSPSRFAP